MLAHFIRLQRQMSREPSRSLWSRTPSRLLAASGFSGFFSGSESNKMSKVTAEVTKKQLLDEEDEEDMEEMFVMGPSKGKIEWGGPTRGGRRPEPTRYGDWERKGRVTDF